MTTTPQKARIPSTKYYDMFDMHYLNRPLREAPLLEKSMRKYGFLESEAITVKPLPNGKYGIIKGHNRFDYAKRLGLPVFYIVIDTDVDLADLEGSSKQAWSISDFAEARARGGDEACMQLVRWSKDNHIPLGIAASLLAGESAGSSNAAGLIRSGRYHLGPQQHASDVLDIVNRLRELHIDAAESRMFIQAISLCLRVPEFSSANFIHKAELYPGNMRKRVKLDEMFDEIETLYNYGGKGGRLAVAFRAKEVAMNRKNSFGKKN